MTNPLRQVMLIGHMAGDSMTKKTFTFTKRLLMVVSAALSLASVALLETNLKGVTHV
jgi:hypothetical protein